MSSGDVRVGLVGYGMAGREIHAPLLRAADGVVVSYVVTSNPERASAATSELPGAHVVPSADVLWEHAEEIDLVVLASPNHAHVPQARAAVERGLAVVVDKPLARSADEARPLVELAAAKGVPLTVFQNRRWDPEHLTARQVVRDGQLGQVLRYEARYERWRPVPKSRWREQLPSEAGGGQLMDLQSHLVDGAVDLFGRVVWVFAELSSVTTVGDDVAFLVLGHESGVSSHLGATSLAGAPGPRTRILGRDAAYLVAEVTGESTAHESWRDLDESHRGWLVRGDDRVPVRRAAGGWQDFYAGVLATMREGAAPPVDPRAALAVLEVLDAARRSARDGAVVRLGA
jgi:predicted dehydrogenase